MKIILCKMMDVAEGKGCRFLPAQYANKGELVLRCNVYAWNM